MKKRLLVWICSLLAVVLLLPSFSVSAQSAPPEVSSTAAVLYNLETDRILFEKNTDVRLSPAAFTKLMTALLSYEYRAANGNVTVTVTEEMLSAAGGTSMRLKAGEVITFDQLLSGLVVQNANDAALVLASVAGGSIASFVEQMNKRAKELGMEHTYYANPTGVDAAMMYTSLQDTLILCKALYRVNDFILLSETPKITIPATNLTEERIYTNKNALIPFSYVTDYYMEGARGIVAGYTQSAGYCVASVHQKTNATYLAIVSGGTDRSEAQNQTDISSYREVKALLEWGEEAFSIQEVLPKGKALCEKKVRLSAGVDHMILVSGESFSALLPSDLKAEEITYEIHSDSDTVNAPIIEGDSYGTLDILYQGEVLGTVPLTAQSNIGLSRWLVTWDAIVGFFSQGPAKVVLILAITAAVLYVLILIGTVWVQYIRKNRAKRLAIEEINRQETERMRKVRLEEKKAASARMHRVKIVLREGYRVLSGESDAFEAPTKRQKRPQAGPRAVAKVPEKYRKAHPSQKQQTSRGASPASRKAPQPLASGERYRVTPSKPHSQSPQRVQRHSQQNRRAPGDRSPSSPHDGRQNTRRWPD